MLVVSGETVGLWAMRATCRQRTCVDCAREPGRQRRRLAVRGDEPGAGHAPRLVHRRGAAGHAQRAQRRESLERDEIAHEHLSAPDRPVAAVPRAVVDRADGRPFEAVLRKACGEVRVVVLDARQLDAVELERVGRRGVVGVQVVGDERGLQREQPLEVLDALAVGEQRRVVLQVADVVAHPGAALAGQAERRLELPAAGQDRTRRGDGKSRCSPGRSRASAAA